MRIPSPFRRSGRWIRRWNFDKGRIDPRVDPERLKRLAG
jgi:hypothetical protein